MKGSVGQVFTAKDLQKYLRNLSKEFVPAAIRGLHSGAARGVTVVQTAVTRAEPASANGKIGAFNTGAYRGGWRWSKLPEGGSAIYNTKAYAPVIEGGRRAGAKPPPIKAIAAWARRKLGLSAKQALAAAYPIQKAIAKRGLRPRRVLSKVIPHIEKIVMIEVNMEIDEVIRGRSK